MGDVHLCYAEKEIMGDSRWHLRGNYVHAGRLSSGIAQRAGGSASLLDVPPRADHEHGTAHLPVAPVHTADAGSLERHSVTEQNCDLCHRN